MLDALGPPCLTTNVSSTMIFFTRELYEGYQDKSGWTRTATTKANRQRGQS